MSTEFIEILDTALEHLRKKDPILKILELFPDQDEHLASLLHAAETLNSIQPVKMPFFEAMQSDRAEFLANIEQIETPSISSGLLNRIKEWTETAFHCPQISLFYPRKEKWNMSTILVRATLVLGLLFGATGGVYAMADNSMPNEPMYGAKLAMEQVQLNMASDPVGIAARHMVMAQNRAQEIVGLAEKGTPPDDGTMTRLEYHLNEALHFSAQMGTDGEMLGLLTQARLMVQEQLQAMNRIQINDEAPLQEPLRLTLRLLNQFQNRVDAGLQDPQAFRWQHQNGQYGNSVAPPGQPDGNPDCPNCPCEGCEPDGDGNKYGQSGDGAPGGPGGNPKCPSGDCVPVGDEHKYGQADEGAPGQPGGNPDCPSDDCVPAGDEHKYGQSEEDPPGQPGGNPDCTCEDCIPEGDENQYGPQPEQPGPGQPGGNPDCPDCVPNPDGDQNQNGKN